MFCIELFFGKEHCQTHIRVSAEQGLVRCKLHESAKKGRHNAL